MGANMGRKKKGKSRSQRHRKSGGACSYCGAVHTKRSPSCRGHRPDGKPEAR